MRVLREKYKDDPKSVTAMDMSKLVKMNAEHMEKSDGGMLTDYESLRYKNEMMLSGTDQEIIERKADRKVSVDDKFDLNTPKTDPVKRNISFQSDMEAFIYPANFDNDLQTDYFDEF